MYLCDTWVHSALMFYMWIGKCVSSFDFYYNYNWSHLNDDFWWTDGEHLKCVTFQFLLNFGGFFFKKSVSFFFSSLDWWLCEIRNMWYSNLCDEVTCVWLWLQWNTLDFLLTSSFELPLVTPPGLTLSELPLTYWICDNLKLLWACLT